VIKFIEFMLLFSAVQNISSSCLLFRNTEQAIQNRTGICCFELSVALLQEGEQIWWRGKFGWKVSHKMHSDNLHSVATYRYYKGRNSVKEFWRGMSLHMNCAVLVSVTWDIGNLVRIRKVDSGDVLCEVVGLRIGFCEHCTETSLSKGNRSEKPNDC
jgi:hypothetical protein